MRRRTFLTQSAWGAAAFGAVALGCDRKRSPTPGHTAVEPLPAESFAPTTQAHTDADHPIADDSRAGPDTMDDVLAILREFGPERGNHAPMGAEALIALGRGDLAVRWAEGYKRRERMQQMPTGTRIAAPEQERALGDTDRIGDWMETLRHAMADSAWLDVFSDWVPRLLPGLAAAATHGVIRTAHAVRSLARADTKLRREELAHALGYWAAHYQAIAGQPEHARPQGSTPPSPRLPSVALADVPIAPANRRRRGMVRSLRARSAEASFAPVIDAARPAPGQESAFLSDLTTTFARVYTVHGASATIPFIHAVTGPSALRLLMSHLAPEDRIRAMSYAWQTAAGLWASFAPGPVPSPDRRDDEFPAPTTAGWQTVTARAIEGGDVHAIKLAEVCLREWRAAPDQGVYLAAAQDVAARLTL